MKYVVFLGDGMADTPVESIGGKTPLMVAKKEHIDALAPKSELGLAKTVPDGMKPGSDTANLAVMGYDPKSCYSGRSPLEALSMGLTLSDTDIAVRCNLVTLSAEEDHYADKRMIDYSAGEISTEESSELIRYIEEHLGDERVSFHPGISYRHCLIVHDATIGSDLTPPHDITGKPIKRHLPSGILGDLFLDLQMKSYDLLKDHPINLKRIAEGKNPANSVWFWGEGTKPNLPDFREKNGISGAVISAVDLLKGIGKGAGMEVINVIGATGNVHTDFAAKGRAAIDALSRVDYVYIHVEAPDESGHQGSLEDKITSIEKIDADIVGPVLAYLKDSGEPYHVLVCPDHPTPLATRTHSADPIPYLIYKSDCEVDGGVDSYDEESAKSTGIFVEEGFRLIDRLLSSDSCLPKQEAISPDLVTTADGEEEIRFSDETNSEDDPFASDPEPTKEEGKTEEEEPADAAPTPPKKSKFAAFFKKHLLLFIILISVVVIAAGLTAGHFIATYHISLIRSEEALTKALSKERITTIVLKKDVTVSSDLILTRSVDFDLNEHTLTVDGDFKIPLDKNVFIGYKTKGEYTYGGKIVANAFSALGTGDIALLADLDVKSASITASDIAIKGDIAGESTVTTLQANSASYEGTAQGTFSLEKGTDLLLTGDVKEIRGGKTVSLLSGTVDTLTGSSVEQTKVLVYDEASVRNVVNVAEFYRVTRLEKPKKVLVVQEDDDFKCYISEVIGATHFVYTLNGGEAVTIPAVKGGTTIITLNSDDLTPGAQTLAIQAIAKDDPRYLTSDVSNHEFEFKAKLSSPRVSVGAEDGKVYLTILDSIKHADKYVYTIDGVEHTTTELKNDISEDVAEGGVHIFEVKAQSANAYFEESDLSMTSYVTYKELTTPVVTPALLSDKVTFTWGAIEGATRYLISYGKDEVYTTDLTYSFTYLEGENCTIQAIGGGYYTDSESATVTADEINPPVPAEE